MVQVHLLQRLAFKYYRDQLQDLAFASSAVVRRLSPPVCLWVQPRVSRLAVAVVQVADRTKLRQYLGRLDEDSLRDMASRLKLLDPQTDQALLHRTDLIREVSRRGAKLP